MQKCKGGATESQGTSWHVGQWTRGIREYRVWSIEYRLVEGSRAGGLTRGSAKVQIGAELLCKSAKVFLGLEPELGLGLENLSGLGSQPSGLGHWSLGVHAQIWVR